MMAVPIDSGDSFSVGNPTELLVLASLAVDQAASPCSCGHETVGRAGVPVPMTGQS